MNIDLDALADIVRIPDWHARAACNGDDPRLWDEPETPEETAAAAQRAKYATSVCARCPVRRECRDEAEQIGASGMIWAGQMLGPPPRPAWSRSRRCRVCTAILTPKQRLYCGRPCRRIQESRVAAARRAVRDATRVGVA